MIEMARKGASGISEVFDSHLVLVTQVCSDWKFMYDINFSECRISMIFFKYYGYYGYSPTWLWYYNTTTVPESKFALRATWQVSDWETRCGGDGYFIWKASRQRRWQTNVSKQPSYEVWMTGSFSGQRLREVRKQSKKAINLANIS